VKPIRIREKEEKKAHSEYQFNLIVVVNFTPAGRILVEQSGQLPTIGMTKPRFNEGLPMKNS
jgi:hypothetical protein